MVYLALYRKYRPETFADVVGQDHVKKTLMNAVRKDQMSHAYLFSGPRGTGKTSVARILARAANCLELNDGEPCGKCENCKGMVDGVWGVIEIDGASHNSVEDIRGLQEIIHHVPMKGKFTVYIIDEVHMLSRPAFNAFLKTLEEPPRHTKFILATTEPYRLPKTILSRCQHFAFSHISLEQIKNQVERIATSENVEIDPEAAEFLALHGSGSMRDTLSLLDQAVIYCGDKIDLQSVKELIGVAEETIIGDILDAMISHNSVRLMELVDTIISSGQDLPETTTSIIHQLRNIMLVKSGVKSERILGFVGAELPRIEKQGKSLTDKMLLKSIEYLSESHSRLKRDVDQRLAFETALLGVMMKLTKETETDQPVQKKSKLQQSHTSDASIQEKANSANVIEKKESHDPPAEKVGKLVPDFLKGKPQTDSPSDTDQKKTLNDNFTESWKIFSHWLTENDLSLAILINGIQVDLSNSTLSLMFSQKEEFRYNFAVQDNIANRLKKAFLDFFSVELEVKLIRAEKIQMVEDRDVLPEIRTEFKKSKKVEVEELIKENFMTLFPDGTLQWEDSNQ